MGVLEELERLQEEDNQKTIKRQNKILRKRVKRRIAKEKVDVDLRIKNRINRLKTKSVDNEFILVDSDEESDPKFKKMKTLQQINPQKMKKRPSEKA